MSKLLIANDTGSKELIAPLQKLGLPAEPANLDFGDIVFMGRGERGAKLWIGIELKTITEFAQSMVSKRFQGHQLLGMVDPEAGFDRRYLLLEGDFHSNAAGQAVVYRGGARGVRSRPIHGASNAVAFEQEIINIQTRGGFWVKETTSRQNTLRFIQACYRYWTDKDLDQHKSHMAMYAPDLDKGLLTPPSDFRKALTVLLPNIGFTVSAAVERYVQWGCIPNAGLRALLSRTLDMTDAEWAALEIPSSKGDIKRFGMKRAKQIMEALR